MKKYMKDSVDPNKTIITKTPLDRLDYRGDLGPVVERLAEAYGIGTPAEYSVIERGYEDCNVIVRTSRGKYVAKMFAKYRSKAVIDRYRVIMEKVVQAGVNHPRLQETSGGETVFAYGPEGGISMVLMDFVEGRSFQEMDRVPNEEERKAVLEQATKVNAIDHHPSYLSDSWAIPNIGESYQKVKKFIGPDDLKLVDRVLDRYGEIPIDELPHCFVHGDFTKGNVLKGNDGKIYILDFSVSNWYPRIQELSVIAANLFHEEGDGASLRDRVEYIMNVYGASNPLALVEKRYLYDYALAGVVMEFFGAHQEKFLNGNDTEETEYWMRLGREGLRRELV
jgi:Ser/Thr protein kinase RdoA (MazF antagonist)